MSSFLIFKTNVFKHIGSSPTEGISKGAFVNRVDHRLHQRLRGWFWVFVLFGGWIYLLDHLPEHLRKRYLVLTVIIYWLFILGLGVLLEKYINKKGKKD